MYISILFDKLQFVHIFKRNITHMIRYRALKQLLVILQETQGRSLFVYTLCVSTRYSIYKWYVEVCKPYVEVCSRAKRKLVSS